MIYFSCAVTQWEVPSGFIPPIQSYPSYAPTPITTSEVTTTHTTSQAATSQDQEDEPSTQKRSGTPDSNEDGPSSPKRTRRSGPYGRWETVAEYEYVEPVPENVVPEEANVEETKEEVVEFEEKTLPVKEETEPEAEREYSGGFKTFSFKKRGKKKAPIKLRTTQLS